MGCVFAAIDLTLDREVAIKMLLPGADADRFVPESKITARLPHPGIPPVHALGTLDRRLALPGDEAHPRPNAGRPAEGTHTRRPTTCRGSCRSFEQVCQAVGFAHSRASSTAT